MCEEFELNSDLFDSVVSSIKSSKHIQVWGIGNILLGDDAVGPIISTQLGGIDCGTTPENFTRLLRINKPDILVIIDAADMGLKVGAVRMLHFNELNDAFVTSHGIPLSILFEQFSKSINIILVGIQPKQTNPGEPLSPEVKSAADFIVEELKKYL